MTLLVTGVCAAAWYFTLRSTVRLMMETEYPGKRSDPGGALGWARILSGYYDVFYSEHVFPAAWQNICEASNLILLFPAVLLGLGGQLARRRKLDRLQAALALYITVLWIWMTAGLPHWLARATLLDKSPPQRSLVALGVASLLLTLLYLGDRDERPASPLWRIAAPLLFGALLLYQGVTLHATDALFTWQRVTLVVAWGTLIAAALLERRRVVFAVLLAITLGPGFVVHPVQQGLAPFTDKDLYKFARRVVEREPRARWLVFGDFFLVDFLKVSGAQVFNGTNVVPDFPKWAPLDPDGTNWRAYNRYGHIAFASRPGEELTFFAREAKGLGWPADLFSVTLSPCSEKFRALHIDYVVYANSRPDPSLSCLGAPLDTPNNWAIYRPH